MSVRRKDRGSSLIEFTMVGIPLLFTLIATFELARGMWLYHTMAYALRDASRYAIVHGNNCYEAPNVCNKQVRDIARVIRDSGVGLMPADLTITMETAIGGAVNAGSSVTNTLNNLLTSTAAWPPAGTASQATSDVVIRGSYRYRTALAFFWPGAGPGWTPGVLFFGATSREKIQF
jgi:Flp pilus assembly protein TadG